MKSPLHFGHYDVLQDETGNPVELGRGNMGVTYRAKDSTLHREVALKVIRSDRLSNSNVLERFLREARAAARLMHPNIAAVFQLGEEAGVYFYAMEFARGENLESVIKKNGPFTCGEALRITREVASALAASHAEGIVHRDIKPANLMNTRSASGKMLTKVIDFGLAKAAGPALEEDPAMITNGFVGTLHFASPEQIEGAEIDIRSDIYSLGATLWHLLTGKTVFEGSLSSVVYRQVHEPPPLDRLVAPPEIIELLRWMLAKTADQRPQTPAELSDRLETLEPEVGADIRCELFSARRSETAILNLKNLLRSRRTLALEDVTRILEGIADDVESTWASRGGDLDFRLDNIRVAFGGPPDWTASEAIRLPVRDWPRFTASVVRRMGTDEKAEGGSQLETILEPILVHPAKTCVPALARVAYELLGGNLDRLKNASDGPAPIAALGQEANEVLRRGIGDTDGATFPTARQFCGDLQSSISKNLESDFPSPCPQPEPWREPATEAHKESTDPHAASRSKRKSIALGCVATAVIAAAFLASPLGHRLMEVARQSISGPARAFKHLDDASASAPFVNGLGMQFIKVPIPGFSGKTILFARTETTVAQYAAFAQATNREVIKPEFEEGANHPAVNISWDDATAFCAWLSETEKASQGIPARARYRLPTDHEWSCAVGIGDREDPAGSPSDLSGAIAGVYPWGTIWPPPAKSGNYADASAQRAGAAQLILDGYDDGFPYTSPVEAFPANALGLYDLGGNASEWSQEQTLRGACWRDSDEFYLRSSFRGSFDPHERFAGYGFRVVLEVAAGK